MNESLENALSDCHLEHVAIAVGNLEDAIGIYEDVGIKFDKDREVVPSQGVTVAFAQVDKRCRIELLGPLKGGSGAIHNFISKRGGGIHHLCFRVSDVEKKCEELKKKGYILTNDTPVPGRAIVWSILSTLDRPAEY